VIDVPGFTPFAGTRSVPFSRTVARMWLTARLSAPDVRLIIGFDHDLTGGKIVYDVAQPRAASEFRRAP
jgi:hypothetical protein